MPGNRRLVAFSGDTLFHRLVNAWPWLAGHTFVIGATTAAAAGLFQFSGWKVACLATCHLTRGAHGRRAEDNGFGYGCASVSCCWALMLVMFGVGVGGRGWMAGLTAAVLDETHTPRAWRMRQVVGIALLALAALWLAHPAWLVAATAA